MKEATSPSSETVRIWGPASLSNLGPGFDTLGLCLRGPGDIVEAWLTEAPGVVVVTGEGSVNVSVPTDPTRNTAAWAASVVMEQAAATSGITLCIRKGIPLGSGIGGSAASAVAGAWAANALLGYPFLKEALVEAVLGGEKLASGTRHGDNVLPALFGGLILVSPTEPSTYRRIVLPRPLSVAVILPRIEIFTGQARALLPGEVSFHDAIQNAADLAFMLEAFRQGDWEAAGRHMMTDRLVEPVRAALVPCYDAVREAALGAGAYGCALSGSGPALFAITETQALAEKVREAMLAACRRDGIEAKGLVTEVDPDGVRTL
ncbi:MAG: homoserine kinase [Rhodothermales bacterium]